MLMNRVLDSYDSLRDPDERSRPLKRSASVASLPTPPRTHRKRPRSRARSSVSQHEPDNGDSASELDDLGRGYTERVKRVKTASHDNSDDENSENESPNRKKRRTLGVLPGHDEDEEDENAFWTGRSGPSCDTKQEKKVAHVDETEENLSPSPAMLRYRVKAPVSPPPSRRQPLLQPTRATSVERDDSLASLVAPVTPPRKVFPRATSPTTPETFSKSKAISIWPERDSPNNPFLIESSDNALPSQWDSSDDDDEADVIGEARVREGTPTPTYEEKPTITYVFRGQKATFHNPLYGLPPEVIAASKLPIDHPDYEAPEACPPKKLLFSAGKRKFRDRSHESGSTEGIKRAKIQPSWDDQTETDEGQSSTGTESCKEPFHADSAEMVTVPSKPPCKPSCLVDAGRSKNVREEPERRETATKIYLASSDGVRAGAVPRERDEPARCAMGTVQNA